MKLEPDDPDFVHDMKHEADGDEIIILSSDEEDDFAPIPVKQEPQSPKIKKKKKHSNLVSSVTAPSPGVQNPSTSKSRKKSGDKHVIAIQVTIDGRVLCYKGCGKSFGNKYNMVKHIHDEIVRKIFQRGPLIVHANSENVVTVV